MHKWSAQGATFDSIIIKGAIREQGILCSCRYKFTHFIPYFFITGDTAHACGALSKQATTRASNLLDSAHCVPNHISYDFPQLVLSSVQNQCLS